ncbi:impA domain protein, partial [Yersinia pestis PY-91]
MLTYFKKGTFSGQSDYLLSKNSSLPDADRAEPGDT